MATQKEHIIEHAMQMFISQGIKSVRMDDISSELGLSKRTLYELFGDKENLLCMAMEHYGEVKRLRWSEISEGAQNVLEALFRVLGEELDNADRHGLLVDSLRKFHPAVYERVLLHGRSRQREILLDMLRHGISDGLFMDSIDIDLMVSIFYYTTTALVTKKEFMLPASMSEREAFVQMITCFFRGISTEKGVQMVNENLKRYDPARSKR